MRHVPCWDMASCHWIIGTRSFENTRLSANIGDQLPSDAASYTRRTDTFPSVVSIEGVTGFRTTVFWEVTPCIVADFSQLSDELAASISEAKEVFIVP
jgi:hypothetical protein